VINNILDSNFNFLEYQILYPIAKFAPFKSKKLYFHNVINLRKNNNPGHLFMLFKQKDIWDYCIFIQQNQS